MSLIYMLSTYLRYSSISRRGQVKNTENWLMAFLGFYPGFRLVSVKSPQKLSL